MEEQVFVNLISTVGFPIAAFIVVAWLLYREMQERAANNKEWASAIERNTAVMTKVLDRMEEEHNAHAGN